MFDQVRRPRRQGSRSNAQAMVEFAVVLPLFLFLMIGVFDCARMLFIFLSMTNATRDMARQAILISGTSNAAMSTDATRTVNAFTQVLIMPGEISATDKVCLWASLEEGTTTTPSAPCSAEWAECPLNNMSTCVSQLTSLTDATSGNFRKRISGGFVDVYSIHQFKFNPFFSAIQDSFNAFAGTDFYITLTTETRAYVE